MPEQQENYITRQTNRAVRDGQEELVVPHLPVDPLPSLALERMGACQVNALPVGSRANVHKREGIVTLQDVLALYGAGPSQKA